MAEETRASAPTKLTGIVKATGEEPIFMAGDKVRISIRFPIGHFRVPNYIRGKRGTVEAVIQPAAVNNEEEGYGRNAGRKRHYYRVTIPLTEVWDGYAGSMNDNLRIEVFERANRDAECGQSRRSRRDRFAGRYGGSKNAGRNARAQRRRQSSDDSPES